MRPHLRAVPLPDQKQKETILHIERLSKVFHMNSGYLPVLDKISFKAQSGELICILGRSGCGKSTLLKIIAGFLSPSSGRVVLNEKPVTTPGPDRCVIFQEDALFPWLTVWENIAFGLKGQPRDKKTKTQEVGRFLGLVGLSEFRDIFPERFPEA